MSQSQASSHSLALQLGRNLLIVVIVRVAKHRYMKILDTKVNQIIQELLSIGKHKNLT